MIAFLVVALFVIVIVAMSVGIAISLYLFNQGAVGKKRTRRFRTLAIEALSNESAYSGKSSMLDAETQYARTAMFVLLGGMVVLVTLILTLIHTVMS
ncbi:MAG: hypothetical protein M3Z24_00995 [Chloroflexota bacterium]|nr:hypothetical protein [Chloroflexota bacterium]